MTNQIFELHILIPLRPVPCPRPRVTLRGTYYPKSYQAWRAAALEHIPTVEPRLQSALDVFVGVALPPFKTVSRDWPRGDVDNYAKAALDVINKRGTVWVDDIQVVSLTVQKTFSDEPHTSIHIRPFLGSTH